MQALLRLAGWGIAAATALALAVAAAYSSAGQQRWAALTGKVAVATIEPTPAASDPEQLARLLATELETQRLLEMVRSLAFDRERMMTRLAAVERNLEDVTGSIRKQAASPPAAQSSAPPSPPVETAPEPGPPSPAVSVPMTPAEQPQRVATVTPSGETTEPEAAQRPAVGVDLGGATNFDGLRALWHSLATSHGGMLENLHPIVIAVENRKTRAADLRLVAGPLEDQQAAARICTTLNAAKRYCRPAVFEGLPLALAAPEPPPQPKAVPRKAAQPRPPANP